MTLCALALAIGITVAGCADQPPAAQPSFYRSLAQPGAEVDGATAASMVSGYRRNNALGELTLDPELTRLAFDQARNMAARNKLDQTVSGPLAERVRKLGYNPKIAAENVSAGYHTLAEAFSGWRDSAPHRANMLLRGATRMGIAAVYAPNSKYKVFWALIVAAPDERKG